MKSFTKIGFFVSAFTAFIVFSAVINNNSAAANGVQIAPLEYQTSLDGLVKKGSVDISNPSGYAQRVTIQVQAFKQIDSQGTLKFYNNSLISAGITPDYKSFNLKPDESIHLFFELNGKKLPKKQIFAALLAQAKPIKASYNITPVLRVGTLLILRNGNGDPAKQGQISDWHVSLFQFGDAVTGTFKFENSETGPNASGYFPNFKVQLGGASKSFSGNLLFPGIKRKQSFRLDGSHIGIHKLKLTSDAKAGADQWVIVLTGYWRWLLPIIIVLAIGLIVLAVRLLKAKPIHISKRHKR